MNPSHLKTVAIAAALTLLLTGCRPEPGEPDYASQEVFDFSDRIDATFLPGPSPFIPGQQRLSLGIFYEGGASQTISVDGVTRHFFIYSNEATEQPTFSQTTDETREEGLIADRIAHSGGPWWGGGVHWDVPQDLSLWGTVHVSLNSDDPAFSDLDLGMESANGVGVVKASDYGFTNDGQWHNLAIPLADFADKGVDLTQVGIALRFGGFGGMEGESVLIDNLYLTP